MSAVLSQPGGAAASLATHGNVGAVRAVTEQTPLIADAENHAALGNREDSSGRYEEEGWNDSKINVARYVCTNITFLVMGMNDACVGVSSDPS
jgi:hypothetical protein